MSRFSEEVKGTIRRSVGASDCRGAPYRHWFLHEIFPKSVYDDLKDMPFPVADLGGVSGTREAHNPDRVYFAGAKLKSFECARAAAEAFQAQDIVALFADEFGAPLANTFLRIEYAQDIDGFWLKPHTDIGVKMFTMLIYMSDDPRHAGLGTDIYCGSRDARRPLALRAELGDDFCAIEQHLARLREAPNPWRQALDHRQLRERRLARTRAARLPALPRLPELRRALTATALEALRECAPPARGLD